jgi:hypothetical protein
MLVNVLMLLQLRTSKLYYVYRNKAKTHAPEKRSFCPSVAVLFRIIYLRNSFRSIVSAQAFQIKSSLTFLVILMKYSTSRARYMHALKRPWTNITVPYLLTRRANFGSGHRFIVKITFTRFFFYVVSYELRFYDKSSVCVYLSILK